MKLSEKTISVLKNFSAINPNLMVKAGTHQRTIDRDKVILAEATLEDSFPSDFGIYDLNQFLSNLSVFENPDISFKDNHLEIVEGNFKLHYFYCSPNHIKLPPDKSLDIPSPDAEFHLTYNSLQKLLKIASLNNLPTLTVYGESGGLYVKTHEKNNSSSNYASSRLDDYSGKDFEVTFKIESLKIIPDSYNVKINVAGFAIFANSNNTIKYFIALDK